MTDRFADEIEMTEEEKAHLANDTTVPPAEEPGPPDATAPQAAEGSKAPEAAAAAPAAEDAEAAKNFAAFVERHKGKPPEELLRLAYQQDAARSQARGELRDAKERINTIQQGLAARVDEVRRKQEAERKEFDEKLATDPDAATRQAFERVQQQEMAAVEGEQWQAYLQEQQRLAQSFVPDFAENAPKMLRFGVEKLGYDEAQVRAAHDARDIAALYMASRFGDLIERGIVDMRGNLVNGGAAGAVGAPAPKPATDPRLGTVAPPRTLSNAGGSSGSGGGQSLQDKARALLSMKEADFAKIPAEEIESVLAGLAGAGR